jgi:hypothetical protein
MEGNNIDYRQNQAALARWGEGSLRHSQRLPYAIGVQCCRTIPPVPRRPLLWRPIALAMVPAPGEKTAYRTIITLRAPLRALSAASEKAAGRSARAQRWVMRRA